jgi:hypothetical protein
MTNCKTGSRSIWAKRRLKSPTNVARSGTDRQLRHEGYALTWPTFKPHGNAAVLGDPWRRVIRQGIDQRKSGHIHGQLGHVSTGFHDVLSDVRIRFDLLNSRGPQSARVGMTELCECPSRSSVRRSSSRSECRRRARSRHPRQGLLDLASAFSRSMSRGRVDTACPKSAGRVAPFAVQAISYGIREVSQQCPELEVESRRGIGSRKCREQGNANDVQPRFHLVRGGLRQSGRKSKFADGIAHLYRP